MSRDYTTGEKLAAALDWYADGRPDPMPDAVAAIDPEDRDKVFGEIDNLTDILAAIRAQAN